MCFLIFFFSPVLLQYERKSTFFLCRLLAFFCSRLRPCDTTILPRFSHVLLLFSYVCSHVFLSCLAVTTSFSCHRVPLSTQVLSQLGVWILDTHALGEQAQNPLILKYANPCSPSGVLCAMQQALFPSGPQPRPNVNGDPAAAAEVVALDFGPGGTARRRVDNRFQSVGAEGRDALRGFLCGLHHRGRPTDGQLDFLKGLPIFRVHGAVTGKEELEEEERRHRWGGGMAGFTSISGAERLLLAPRNSDKALLGREFAVESDRNAELLESLGVQRVGKGAFFREHVLPRAVEQTLPVGECHRHGPGEQGGGGAEGGGKVWLFRELR